jgi:glycosyltransferase involved in cell wall biosynthesis
MTKTSRSLPIFVSTYPPTRCGIATFVSYIVDSFDKMNKNYGVIAFHPFNSGFPLMPNTNFEKNKENHIEYVLDYTNHYSSTLLTSIKNLKGSPKSGCLIFQHTFGIWKGKVNLIDFLKETKKVKCKKAVTLHTVHFQNSETEFGMETIEYDLLKDVLPNVDGAITMTRGAYDAVTNAFPSYREKVALIRHGIPIHAEAAVSKEKAKEKLFSYLIESEIPKERKRELSKIKKVFFGENTKLIGEIGFVSPNKGSETLPSIRKALEKRMANRNMNVISMCLGSLRDSEKKYQDYLLRLKDLHDGKKNFYIPVYIPKELFGTAIKAFDVNIFWPDRCTQSGRLAHAIGTGTNIAGKDLEGVGETLKMSGCPACSTVEDLVEKTERIIMDKKFQDQVQKKTREYADLYSFENQAKKYIELAQTLIENKHMPKFDL